MGRAMRAESGPYWMPLLQPSVSQISQMLSAPFALHASSAACDVAEHNRLIFSMPFSEILKLKKRTLVSKLIPSKIAQANEIDVQKKLQLKFNKFRLTTEFGVSVWIIINIQVWVNNRTLAKMII